MNTLSATELEKYLNEYSVSLEYWSADMGDSHEMLGARELLESNKSAMDSAQLSMLSAFDDKAKLLLDEYKGVETWDVKMLRAAVAITHREVAQAA